MYYLAAQLKKLRQEKGRTQKEVASGIGIAEQAYQRYEYGKSVPSAHVIAALADYFDVPTDYLLGRGLFSNWEQIMKYRDFICENLQPNVPFVRVEAEGQEPKITQIDLKSLDEKSLMLVLSALVEHIEIIEEDGKLISCTCVVLPLYVDGKGDKPSNE